MVRTLRDSSGFTLVELLVTIGIIAILSAVSLAGLQAAMKQGYKAQEMAAARNLVIAYTTAADPDSGQFLPGYDRTVGNVAGPGGVPLSGPAAERYPWRLAPYLNNNVNGTILVGNVTRQIDTADTYMVSCYPTFGINYIFVGGDKQTTGALTYPNECITRMINSVPVLVFASAAATGTSQSTISGYCILTPPNLTGPMWSSAKWTNASNPGDYGNVDGRFNGKAVCAFLDGSVSMKSPEELRDMTLWSRTAALTGNANYTVTDTAPHGGRL